MTKLTRRQRQRLNKKLDPKGLRKADILKVSQDGKESN